MSGTTTAVGTNQFNIGSDTQLTIISNGTILPVSILIDFDAKQMTADLDSTALNGVNSYRHVEKGWDLSFGFDRTDASIDEYFAAKEVARYTPGSQPPAATITETTYNVDGSISIFRYNGVTLKLDTIGSRKGDAKVEPKVSGKATQRVQVQ